MRCPTCPVPCDSPCHYADGHDPAMCERAGDPAWARHIVGRSAIGRQAPTPRADKPRGSLADALRRKADP